MNNKVTQLLGFIQYVGKNSPENLGTVAKIYFIYSSDYQLCAL